MEKEEYLDECREFAVKQANIKRYELTKQEEDRILNAASSLYEMGRKLRMRQRLSPYEYFNLSTLYLSFPDTGEHPTNRVYYMEYLTGQHIDNPYGDSSELQRIVTEATVLAEHGFFKRQFASLSEKIWRKKIRLATLFSNMVREMALRITDNPKFDGPFEKVTKITNEQYPLPNPIGMVGEELVRRDEIKNS